MSTKCLTCHGSMRKPLDPTKKVRECRNPKCEPKKKQYSAKSTFPSLKTGGKHRG